MPRGRTSTALVSVVLAAAGALLTFSPALAIAADPTGSITGTVTDSTHQPVAGVCVRGYDSADEQVGFDETGSNGVYRLESLGTGDYRLKFEDCGQNVFSEYYDDKPNLPEATPVAVTDGAETSGIDAELVKGGSISGHVSMDTGSGPNPDLCVTASEIWGLGGGNGEVQPDGSYKVVGLETGNYTVEFRGCGADDNVVSEYYPDKLAEKDATRVPVTRGQEVTGIDATLTPGGTISGTVAPDGRIAAEVCGMQVDAFDSNGDLVGRYQSESFLYTSIDYKINKLPPGDYRVSFTQSCLIIYPEINEVSIDEFFNDESNLATATPVTVPAGGKVSGINAVLGPEGSVSGRVTDQLGKPLEAICVEAFDSDGKPAGVRGHTDSLGRYLVNALFKPSYRLKFSDCQDVNAAKVTPEFYDDEATLAEAKPVSVSLGTVTTRIDAQLVTAPRPVPPVHKAKISRVSVQGPARVRKGSTAKFKVRITNSGNIGAAGTQLKVRGRGVNSNATVGRIPARTTRTVWIKLRPKLLGKTKLTFRVTSGNAGGKSVKRHLRVTVPRGMSTRVSLAGSTNRTIYNHCHVAVWNNVPHTIKLTHIEKHSHDSWVKYREPSDLRAPKTSNYGASMFAISESGFARGCWNILRWHDSHGTIETYTFDPYSGHNRYHCKATGAYHCYHQENPGHDAYGYEADRHSGDYLLVNYKICMTGHHCPGSHHPPAHYP